MYVMQAYQSIYYHVVILHQIEYTMCFALFLKLNLHQRTLSQLLGYADFAILEEQKGGKKSLRSR